MYLQSNSTYAESGLLIEVAILPPSNVAFLSSLWTKWEEIWYTFKLTLGHKSQNFFCHPPGLQDVVQEVKILKLPHPAYITTTHAISPHRATTSRPHVWQHLRKVTIQWPHCDHTCDYLKRELKLRPHSDHMSTTPVTTLKERSN